jgi:hypothetical protein
MKKTIVWVTPFQYKLHKEFFSQIENDSIEIYCETFGLNINVSDFMHSKYSNCNFIYILNDVAMQHTNGVNHRNPATSMVLSTEYFSEYFKNEPSSTKYILLDDNGESLNPFTRQFLIDWLNISNMSTYLISSRFYNLNHSNAITGLTYLPILYMFLQQNFRQFPMLNYSSPSNPKDEFITYLGQSEKPDKRNIRYGILNHIFKNDLTGVNYKEIENFKTTNSLFGAGKPGHYWNILNSLSAKIQIIFENYPHRSNDEITDMDYDEYFFTEKIMKCFILPHPYLLIVNKLWLNKLEQFGFKFHELSKGETIDDFKQIIEDIKSDMNGWIETNKPYFEHNQRNLYEIGKSINLPHHQFLKQIILNNI